VVKEGWQSNTQQNKRGGKLVPSSPNVNWWRLLHIDLEILSASMYDEHMYAPF